MAKACRKSPVSDNPRNSCWVSRVQGRRFSRIQDISEFLQDFFRLFRLRSTAENTFRRRRSRNLSLKTRNVLLSIGVGGVVAGTLDLLQACILFGWDIPLVIAGGLLGKSAFHGGTGTYVLGTLLH